MNRGRSCVWYSIPRPIFWRYIAGARCWPSRRGSHCRLYVRVTRPSGGSNWLVVTLVGYFVGRVRGSVVLLWDGKSGTHTCVLFEVYV